jgi:hypothetical protein
MRFLQHHETEQMAQDVSLRLREATGVRPRGCEVERCQVTVCDCGGCDAIVCGQVRRVAMLWGTRWSRVDEVSKLRRQVDAAHLGPKGEEGGGLGGAAVTRKKRS